MPATDTLLSSAERCLLAHRTDDGPALTSHACWSDGANLWVLISRTATVAALREDPRCIVLIAPPVASEPGVCADGAVRLFDLSDPAGLWLHAATISAALAALALTHRAELRGYVRLLSQLPGAPLPQRPVLVRVRVEHSRSWPAPQPVTGVGPVLPAVVPGAVRRALTGVRHVALALQANDQLTVQRAVWSAGYRLDAQTAPAAETPACVVVEQRTRERATATSGLQLRGVVDRDLRLRPTTATWWRGLSTGTAAVPEPASSSGLVLPE